MRSGCYRKGVRRILPGNSELSRGVEAVVSVAVDVTALAGKTEVILASSQRY